MSRNIRTYNKLIKPTQDQMVDKINELIDSVNTSSASAERENYRGKKGDIKINKVANNKFDFYIRGEDGWHRDTNSTYAPVNDRVTQEPVNISIENNGQIDNQYEGTSRILLDLDSSTISGTPSPKIAITGNGTISTTGNATIDSAGDIELNADGGDFSFKDNTSRLGALSSIGLTIDNISACGSDVDKFLVSDSGIVKFRTGAELLSDAIPSSSTTVSGKVELATTAETTTGTDTARAVTPDGLKDGYQGSFNIVTTGPLNSGSITSGFGNIDIGSSTIDTTGNVSVGDLQVNGNDIAFDAAASTIGVDAAAHDTAGARLTLSAGDTTAGTTDNIAGGGLTIEGGQGKGSGAGGNIIFRVANEGSSGSSLNSLATALTISDNRNIVCNGGTFNVVADSGENAEIYLIADYEDDDADTWRLRARDSDSNNRFVISNKISGVHIAHLTILPNATVASSSVSLGGSLAVNGTSGITAGAVIWQSFPFYAATLTNGRFYYIDVDDNANSFRKWDDYDTDPTGFNYRDVAGQFVVPEDCTLVAMHGVIANQSSTNNPTVSIYHGTVTEGTGNTTLALSAGSGGAALTVTTGTLRVPFKFNDTFSVDLSAGDIVVPTISHADSGGTRSFSGSLTLKFITR